MEAGFWHLEKLSDQQLLQRLQGTLQTKRRVLAELIAQLGEVEERRLHLQMACGSLFHYCVHRLGMSEDEACRRIEVARLARRFPALFAELASGGTTLSVALLLKRVLLAENQTELIAAVRGASTERAREILAARFPRPDVPSRIRKLPERRSAVSQPAEALLTAPIPAGIAASPACTFVLDERPASEEPQLHPPRLCTTGQPEPSRRVLHQHIEPLSAGRYRVQFTADISLKRKLEQARDVLRHAQPNGDLGAIVSRALDCLLEELMGRRFGKLRNERVLKRAEAPLATPLATPSAATILAPVSVAAPATAPVRPTATEPATPTVAAPLGVRARARSPIARAARRAVLERDGLRCSWIDAHGTRCSSTAWLELDHCHPAGKGGSGEPENLRMLCRAHNRFAAERAYGRAHVERAVRARQCAAPLAPPQRQG